MTPSNDPLQTHTVKKSEQKLHETLDRIPEDWHMTHTMFSKVLKIIKLLDITRHKYSRMTDIIPLYDRYM